ncbi:MAG: flagellar biosynthesis protein FlgI, partial [Planctomycetota bacterium]
NLRISRFQAGKPDRRVVVAPSVPSMIEGIISVGGSYGDVVQILRMAKSKGYLMEQLAIDPLPKPLRTYYRDDVSQEKESTPDSDREFTGSGV